MNFQQLRIIRETVRQNYNLTEASAALYTSQSGVSKHIKDLEDELGVQLFIRKGKRLLGLTEPGQALLSIVERMLIDADNIKRLADDFNKVDEGTLTIALDITVTEELRQEGIARELVNRIQNLRKSSGYEITDKIAIKIERHEEINAAVDTFNTYIASQVLAVSLELVNHLTDATELDFEDFIVKVAIHKI